MNNNLAITKLLIIIGLLCTTCAYSSQDTIDKANLIYKVNKYFGTIEPVKPPSGEMHKVKNKKGQVRRVWARKVS